MKKDLLLNTLAGFIVVAWLISAIVMLAVYLNPYSSINPFPPAKLPTLVIIPSATATLRGLPPTWTATPSQEKTLIPSSTLAPTSTGFVLPSFTPTPTKTSTRTNTPTRTLTPTRTSTATLNYEQTAQAQTQQSCQQTQAAGGTCP